MAVLLAEDGDVTRERAARLAGEVGVPLIFAADEGYELLLAVTGARVELREAGGGRTVYVDFVGGPMGYARRVKRFGMLFQAVGFRAGRPSVFDATAGLGRDAFRLAYQGCCVTAVERCPAVFALLRDGLERAERDSEINARLGGRLRLVQGEACEVLRGLPQGETPEVVYVDPMFPPKKKSALVKKEMRVLRRLVGDDLDAGELFEAARAAARKRVVVKRLRHAEPLAPNPTHSFRDQTARYDVYVRRA